MKILYEVWWKMILIIIVSILSNIILHTISPIESANISLGEPSIFVKNDMLIPALLVWEMLTFSVFSLVFLFVQKRLPGKKLKKGFLYGLSIGGLYFIGMFESALLFDTTVFTELLMGLPDFVSFVISGTLLGMAVGTDRVQKSSNHNVLVVVIIALFYVSGRYFAYTLLDISSVYDIKPAGTFFWTLGLGLWVGTTYFLMQPENREQPIAFQGLFFGAIIFGLNWSMNHAFLFTIIEFDFDLLIRVGTDILFTIFGVCTYMKLFNRRANLRSKYPPYKLRS
ncbi:hypothetical protein HXA34_11780 [Salipaludibacillus agaradhaerens]|uniref:hypothetical protein n=1 Tax=Salipaludibacillus agaradhaerens TaxID=76935 RepID=UPI002150E2AB|nr:hypothetical protein [Salipaludibacillus agaradhaerens]MCR6106969.1 hypothetical protein [Salipaludibacillus agaradhaerens]MCR6119001.1 hypothetical protein [Salipaludibacillus agaradhaerens]